MYKNCFKVCLLNIIKKALIPLEMKLVVFIREKNVENKWYFNPGRLDHSKSLTKMYQLVVMVKRLCHKITNTGWIVGTICLPGNDF